MIHGGGPSAYSGSTPTLAAAPGLLRASCARWWAGSPRCWWLQFQAGHVPKSCIIPKVVTAGAACAQAAPAPPLGRVWARACPAAGLSVHAARAPCTEYGCCKRAAQAMAGLTLGSSSCLVPKRSPAGRPSAAEPR